MSMCTPPIRVEPLIWDKYAHFLNLNDEILFIFLIFSSASEFNLRWFTPTNEVNLCGHATMATATVIFRALGKMIS